MMIPPMTYYAPELIFAARADALRAEDRSRDADRDRGELYVTDNLIDRSVGRRGARTKTIDERDDRNFGQRHHHHLKRRRQPDAQHRSENLPIDSHIDQRLAVELQRVVLAAQIDEEPCEGRRVGDKSGNRGANDPELRQSEDSNDKKRRDDDGQ
jgi:hypothetical protein